MGPHPWMPPLVEDRTDRDGHTIRLPGNDNSPTDDPPPSSRSARYTFAHVARQCDAGSCRAGWLCRSGRLLDLVVESEHVGIPAIRPGPEQSAAVAADGSVARARSLEVLVRRGEDRGR